MRLTLRTMLAYLDDILEPEDAEKLGQKIEESEFAGGLVHRIRGSMKRIRLGAPRLDGRGIGQDLNSVAEYLESTLPAERVPDFEKVCLDSEMHLAEVASCHQILTLVLREPAETAPGIRDRIYRIDKEPIPPTQAAAAGTTTSTADAVAGADRAKANTAAANGNAATVAGSAVTGSPAPATPMAGQAPAAGTLPVGTAAATAAAGPRAAETADPALRNKPEIPDYLRPEKKSLWPLMLTMLLVFTVVGGALLVIYPPKFSTVAVNGPHQDPAATDQSAPVTTPPEVGLGTPTDPASVVPPTLPVAPLQNDPAIAIPATPPSGDPLPGGISPPSDPVLPPAVNDIPPAAPSDVPPLPAVEDPITPSGGSLPAETLPSGTLPGAATPTTPAVDPTSGSETPRIARIDAPAPVADPIPANTGPTVQGHYITAGETLIKYDAKADDWNRVPVREPISSGDWLLVLPTYRPQIVLRSGLELTLAGGTLIEIGPPSADGTPTIRLKYGRAQVSTIGKAGARINLEIGTRRGSATFENADSSLAMEVMRFHDPGSDPVERPAHASAMLFATNGQVQWLEEGAEIVTIAANHGVVAQDDAAMKSTGELTLPEWTTNKQVAGIDRLASITLEPLLVENRSVRLTLEEQAEHRRVEVRSLAIRCLTFLGSYARSVEALNDESLKSYWPAQYDALQFAKARSRESASQVREAFTRFRGSDGEALDRMIWGYSSDDLSQGEAARLVGYLENDSMDYRVLAFENLRRITGATHQYRPERPPSRSQANIVRWREELKDGNVGYKK